MNLSEFKTIKAGLIADVKAYGPARMRELLEAVIEDLGYEPEGRDKWPVGSRQNPWNRRKKDE